jgi:hypothetical protein
MTPTELHKLHKERFYYSYADIEESHMGMKLKKAAAVIMTIPVWLPILAYILFLWSDSETQTKYTKNLRRTKECVVKACNKILEDFELTRKGL